MRDDAKKEEEEEDGMAKMEKQAGTTEEWRYR